MRAPQRLFHHDAGRQRPFPFQIGPHQARLVERLLHEMHIGVARADQFVAGGVGRLARHQQHRQPGAENIVHGVGGIRRADVDMHQHALSAPGHEGKAARHVRRGVLVRAADDRRHLLAELFLVRHLLDDRGMVGAEIAEQIFDPDLVEAFEKVIRGREFRRVAGARGELLHVWTDWLELFDGFLGAYCAPTGSGGFKARYLHCLTLTPPRAPA